MINYGKQTVGKEEVSVLKEVLKKLIEAELIVLQELVMKKHLKF